MYICANESRLIMKTTYIEPLFEIIEVISERGFAESDPSETFFGSTEGFEQ